MKRPPVPADHSGMSATDFLPRRDVDLLAWSGSFRAKIEIEGEAVGVPAERIAEYAAAQGLFAQTMAMRADPSARSPSGVVAKNTARKALRAQSRLLARMIHGKGLATPHQTAAFGLTVRRPGGKSARHPSPASAPWLSIIEMRGRRVKVRLRDADAPTRRGRPVGVKMAQLFIANGGPSSTGEVHWSLLFATTRTLLWFTLPPQYPPGSKVWLTAHWVGSRGQTSSRAAAQVATVPHLASGPLVVNRHAARVRASIAA
jgi:hypothetical protein